ncbi:PREDICTED: DNA repair protein complementing XP-A cells homolog isoform X2 [Priapulus caudatus]|uniref:DNA repair protein complementing XP-A cells homolog isoform X2 n=1 Tax=Priapulus caudatus TaxID=37621 RepID=A0ABM1E2U3_PRICU|nr:PREDICTED: DNA repair protein complementing XP-A cells homolog isoform X2 [Priapulus caudatus]
MSTSSGAELSEAQKTRAERNRLKALQLKKSKLVSRPSPYPNRRGDAKSNDRKPPTVIDTGAGFLLPEEDEDAQTAMPRNNIVYPTGPSAGDAVLTCEECGKDFYESFLYEKFGLSVCNNCRDNDGKHALVTKTVAKSEFLLKDCDLEKREPLLRYIVRKNPHNDRWGDMKLFLRSQVEARAMEVWESQEKLEEAREQREENRQTTKQKQFNKKLKALRMEVRSSLYKKDTGPHQHEYGPESYDEADDIFSKTCKSCQYTLTYEKM